MIPSASELKAGLRPDHYYLAKLPGTFGRPTGNGWYSWEGLCPFHRDKRPGSLFINKASGAFKCFSCGAQGGDIIAFHMQVHQIDFLDALYDLSGGIHA